MAKLPMSGFVLRNQCGQVNRNTPEETYGRNLEVKAQCTLYTHTGKMQAREDLVQQARSHGREVNTDSRHGITDEFLTDTPFNQLVGVKVRHIRSMR